MPRASRRLPSPARVHLALILISLVMFWTSLYVYVPVLPTYAARSLGASLSVVGLVVGAYGFSQLVLRIPIGLGSDRIGRRKPFLLVGMLANALGAATLALAPAAWALILARAILGVGASTYVILSIYLAEFFPRRQVTRAISLAAAITSLSQVGIMLAGGIVAERWDVRVTFWIGVGLGLAGLLLVLPLPERGAGAGSGSRDVRELARTGLRREVVVAALIAVLLQYGTFALTYGFVPVYAEEIGANKTDLGVLATAAVGATALAALAMVYLGNRLSGRTAVIVGFGIAAVGAAVVPAIQNLPLLIASQVVSGFGRGLVFPALMAISIRQVSSAERGTAMGVFQAVYALGMFLGPVTSGALAQWLGLSRVFWVVAAVSLLGALAAGRWLSREPAGETVPERAM